MMDANGSVGNENGQSPALKKLSPRELQIIRLLSLGNECKEAGAALGISRRTVEKHVEHARRKLNAANTPHAVRIASELGLLNPPQTAA